MRLYNALVTALLLFTLAHVTQAQTESEEESAVREAYARLSFASRLNGLYSARTTRETKRGEINASIDRASVTFTIRNVTYGDIRDIYLEPFSKFVDKRAGDVLQVGGASFRYTEDNGPEFLTRLISVNGWDFSDFQNSTAEDWNLPIYKLLGLISDQGPFTRYAAYTVTASHRGKSRTYKGLFLFGHDPNGNSKITVADNVVGNGNVQDFLTADPYPAAYLETRRATPEVLAVLGTYRSDSCTAGKVCCDHSTMRCGLSGVDLDAAAARKQPEPPPAARRRVP